MSGRERYLIVLGTTLIAAGVGCGSEFASGSGDGGAAGGTTSTTTSTGSGGSSTGTGEGGTTPTGVGGGPVGGGTPTGQELCSPPGVFDDFSSSEINPGIWGTETQGVYALLGNGRLHLTPHNDVDGYNYADVYTIVPHSVRDCSVWVEVPRLIEASTPGESYLALWIDDYNHVTISALEGTIRFRVMDGDIVTNEHTDLYDAAEMLWWRILDASGITYLQTSPDGVVWTNRLQALTPSYIDSVGIGLGVSTWGPTGTQPGHTYFDNVNLLPASL
jgi:hypothetical protein